MAVSFVQRELLAEVGDNMLSTSTPLRQHTTRILITGVTIHYKGLGEVCVGEHRQACEGLFQLIVRSLRLFSPLEPISLSRQEVYRRSNGSKVLHKPAVVGAQPKEAALVPLL